MGLPKFNEWRIEYTGWNPEQQQLREALCTLGNGYFATRGAFAGSRADGVNYPGTYMSGGYNRRVTKIAGRELENEDLVNMPNWLCLNFKPVNGSWLDFNQVHWIDYKQILDIYSGTMGYHLHFKDEDGRETVLETSRLVNMADSHLAAEKWSLCPLNWSGRITLRSALDGEVENSGVARYQNLEGRHLEGEETRKSALDSVLLRCYTNQSRIAVVQGARTRIFNSGGELKKVKRRLLQRKAYVGQDIQFECGQGESVVIEKIVSLYSSRDRAISEPGLEAEDALKRAPDFGELMRAHQRTWHRYWHSCDVELISESQAKQQPVMRMHIFHLLQAASIHTVDLDVGVPARGLHGEAYRGHIFWDELFIFPLLNLRCPHISKALLMYRYRRLKEARRAAREAGCRGAMFPWQSGASGREESQFIHLNPKSGHWIPDNTYKQRHINGAIAHNVWRYFQVTNDEEFMAFAGVEILLSIALFWADRVSYSDQKGCYEILEIVGPDEFHTRYAEADSPGLNNNAYTNVMASWCLRIALEAIDWLSETRKEDILGFLEITQEDLSRWGEISRNMFIPINENGIISQFDGYEDLEELDWEGYRKKYGDIQRLDRILEKEGDDINRYKASKQADVLMLFYLFSAEMIHELFEYMGYSFDTDMIPRNLQYYRARTSHGSTLSGIVYSWVMARSDREASWDLFDRALFSDVADIQGGTTSEGIHLGAMAGTVDLALRCYSGMEIRDGILWFDPHLPDELTQIKQKLHYRGHWISLLVNHQRLAIELEEVVAPPVKIGFRNRVYKLEAGQTREFKILPHKTKRKA